MQLACSVDGAVQRCATVCQSDARRTVLRLLSSARPDFWLPCTRGALFDELIELPDVVANALIATLEASMRQHESALAKLMVSVCIYIDQYIYVVFYYCFIIVFHLCITFIGVFAKD